MKFLFLLFLLSCSHSKTNFETAPPLPAGAPPESISKPQNDLNAAIDQTKSYYCIKNADQFKKGISCQEYSQNIHNKCSKKFKIENQILECVLKSLKI